MPPLLSSLARCTPVPLAAGELADPLLLVGAAEVEPAHVRPGVHLTLAELERVLAAGDLLVHRLRSVECVAALVHVGELHSLADHQLPAVGGLRRR